MDEDNKPIIEDTFSNIFAGGASGTGDEELLRIASKYSLQLTLRQLKAILFLEWLASIVRNPIAQRLRSFVVRWLELKGNSASDVFIMEALKHISLRKFLGENSFKVDIQK